MVRILKTFDVADDQSSKSSSQEKSYSDDFLRNNEILKESTLLLESTVTMTENCRIFLTEVKSKQDNPKVVYEPSLDIQIK